MREKNLDRSDKECADSKSHRAKNGESTHRDTKGSLHAKKN